MKNILICLVGIENWKTLGLQLDIPNDELIKFEGANRSNPDLCKATMLNHWLCKKENPSWMTLASAIEDIGFPIPASKIRTKYLQVSKISFLMLALTELAYMYLHYFSRSLTNVCICTIN